MTPTKNKTNDDSQLRWKDLYDSYPDDGADVLLMVRGTSRSYAIGARKGPDIVYLDKSGELGAIPIADVFRREHIRYIELGRIPL